MCGINGIVSFDKEPIDSLEKRIAKMNSSIAHRGPDNNEFYLSQKYAYGHLRLSILDIDSRANQPMRYKNHVLVYNGEIFNYKQIRNELKYNFKTDSDTEVILIAVVEKGIDWFLKKANGFFAFAIMNEESGSIVLARDRFGIKPLIYTKLDNILIFSSEIKGILASGLTEAHFRYDKVEEYLSYRFILEPYTFFSNIYQVDSGTYKEYDSYGFSSTHRYWKLPNTKDFKVKNEKNLIRDLSNKVKQAVEDWAITDVPLGSFLSGGLDSSLTSAILSRNIKNLKTYTIGYDEKGYNEFKYAKLVAHHIGSDHKELKDNLESYNKNWENLIKFKDSPLAVPNEVPLATMCSELKKDITVVISGEGADELFGGYGKIFQLPYELTKNKIENNILTYFIKEYSYVSKSLLNKYFVNQSKSFEESMKNILESSLNNQDFIYRFFHSIHIKGLLARVDMTSMQASVEARPPFLNHELIEYVYEHIPNSIKLKWIDKEPEQNLTPKEYSEIYDIPKYPLKKISEEFIPLEIIYRKKMGFPVPLNEWYDSLIKELDLDSELFENILSRDFKKEDFLNELKQENRFGQSLWMLINLQKFYYLYFKKNWKW